MMNGRHRAIRLNDLVSDLQRYVKQSKGSPEVHLVEQAIAKLQDGSRLARESDESEGKAS